MRDHNTISFFHSLKHFLDGKGVVIVEFVIINPGSNVPQMIE